MAAESIVVLQGGAERGDVTLVERQAPGGEWQFARTTEDQIEAVRGGR